MADRYKFQFTETFSPKTVALPITVNVGTSGAVTTGVDGYSNAAGNSLLMPKGIQSITRNSAGKYTIALGLANTQAGVSGVDSYWDLLGASVTPIVSSATAIFGQVQSTNLAAGTGAPGSVTQSLSQVVVQFVNGSGVATDLPTNSAFTVVLWLKNSQVV